jgi:hypothetical protein
VPPTGHFTISLGGGLNTTIKTWRTFCVFLLLAAAAIFSATAHRGGGGDAAVSRPASIKGRFILLVLVSFKMKVSVTHVNIVRAPNSQTRDEDIGHPDITAAFVKALEVSVPMHNQNWDEMPTTLAVYLQQKNLNHMMVTSKCFMTADYVRGHKEPPAEKAKLIRVDKLSPYELGIECIVTTSGGGYEDGTFSRPTGELTRYMEFIFHTGRRMARF